MNPDVTKFIQELPQPWQQELCTQLRELIWQAVPEAEESIQWHKPHYKKNKKFFAVMTPAKGWLNFMLFYLKREDAPDLFEPGGMSIKFKKGQTIDPKVITKLIKLSAEKCNV
jgi:hypothetical protein